ncbi:MAG: TetR/AcrR family transcriptional regulator C-terminal domain-containing protein [Bauldia sp.]|nr:TetR/AcrR family transcriptional regulator C-terminal domain-containing protein [Bauldia sp.]
MSFVPFAERERPPKRPAIDRDRVVAAALALLGEVGLDGLTMRLLASRLGVKASSLYRHVEHKDELLILIADAIAAMAADVPTDMPWRERVIAQLREYHASLRRIRDAARVLAETPPAGRNRLKKIDALFGAVLASGCSPKAAADACYHLNNLVVSYAADQERAAAWTERAGISEADLAERKRAFTRMLSVDEFPNLAVMAEFAGSNDPDAVFWFGIDLLLDGLEAHVAAARGEPAVESRAPR